MIVVMGASVLSPQSQPSVTAGNCLTREYADVEILYCGQYDGLEPHRRFRGIEWKGVKIYDLQKVTFSTLFKLYIAGLGCADFIKV